jgi:DNA-binding transcriptional ArsR family regulator
MLLAKPGTYAVTLRLIRLKALVEKFHSLDVLAALSALAQENRLDTYRLLVQAGPEGMPAGEVATKLRLAPNTLSFHFDRLRDAELVTVRREKDVDKGLGEIPRHDWLFYQTVIAKLPAGMRRPIFGDYTIVHPNFTPVDMRKIKSAGKIVYTTPKNWAVRKGGAFRDNPAQMHDHCADLVKRPIFKGASYSSGDDYIAKCAVRKEGPSNQTRWKDVAINHHITHVLDDLSTFDGGP